MRPIDIKDIIVGLLTVIAIATAWGQYDNLDRFARREFAKSLTSKGWYSVPFFPDHQVRSKRAAHKSSPYTHQ